MWRAEGFLFLRGALSPEMWEPIEGDEEDWCDLLHPPRLELDVNFAGSIVHVG